MKTGTLIYRNLRFYRRPYLAILVGVMVSTAVLTGALLVGDSVRGSLERLTNLRLGSTRWAMKPGDRFFRVALAADLSRKLNRPVVPVLQLTGIGVNVATGDRVQNIEVVGIDSEFASLWNPVTVIPAMDEVIVSDNLALKLDLQVGDPLLIRLPKVAKTPQNAPFVADETPAASIRLIVRAIAGEENMGRFSLKNNQQAPLNAFVSLEQLGERVGLPGSANLLLIPGTGEAALTTEQLDTTLARVWQVQDAGIRIERLGRPVHYQIVTDRIFFDDQTVQAIRQSLPGAERMSIYLANTFSSDHRETPYSFVAAVDSGILPGSPQPGEIIVTDWLADDLHIRPGDSLTMTYYVMGPLRRLQEKGAGFTVSGIIPLRTIPSGEAMMPAFPGMNDAGHCRDWETGAPIDLDRIRDQDEAYWNTFRGTPKAFISLTDGEKCWANPFGTVTAFRVNSNIDSLILASLDPAWYGFLFRPVWEEGQQAAMNSTDFGGLFLSLSFFLIASALLLTALLFSLHARTRMSEVGVLSGLGFRKREIMRILMAEALLVVIPGAILGALTGIIYNKFILIGLNTLWQDAVRTSMLRMVVGFSTLAFGAISGFILAGMVLFLTLRRQLRKPVSGLVRGTMVPAPADQRRNRKIRLGIGIILVSCSLIFLVALLTTSLAQDAELFLAVGGLMMGGGIFLMNAWLVPLPGRQPKRVSGILPLVWKLGSLKRGRGLAAISLLALGTFTVIITGANRKTFYGAERDRQSGTGGFLLWGESTMPVLYDLNTPSGKSYFGLQDEPVLQDIRYFQLHRLDGNDASCLNLNQVPQPMMLGIPEREFDRLNAFRLVNAMQNVDPKHPWRALGKEIVPGVIPAFADQTVITWGLRKKVGDTLLFRDETGETLRVVLAGGLDNSIFQGHLLVSDSLLKRFFPSISGSRIMLVDGPFDRQTEIANRLEALFVDNGLVTIPASERLAEFNSVENTYLSVFMILGALGVLIGTVGFGIILWRNTLERSAELAIYTVIGFSKKLIFNLLVTEYCIILGAGMGIGMIGALTGILPSLISPAYQMPGGFLLIILAVIWVSGFVWIVIPARSILRKNMVQSLRTE